MFSDHFGWQCANLVIGEGDAYSTAGAEAFLQAARNEDISICKAQYVHNSDNMRVTIKEIIDKKCYSVTVLFGQSQDLAALFVEAHEQEYKGE